MTQTALIPRDPDALALAGQAANHYAAKGAFADYRERKAAQTIRRHGWDLALFASYLADVGIIAGNMAKDPESWRGLTWGLVEGFVRWQVAQGYAIGSINARLSTVKVYARLAAKAGTLEPNALAMIRTVNGYRRSEGKHIDAARETTRRGAKKAEACSISGAIAAALKSQPDTPQGRRDALLMCLLLDHGLRVGEVAILESRHFNLKTGILRFYRPKVDKEQSHRLTADALRAAQAYLVGAPAIGTMLRGSLKSGELSADGMSTRAVTKRVEVLGAALGIAGLSAHDCRHYWATYWAPRVPPSQLLQAGGWTSYATAGRYIEASKIANEGMA